MRVLTADPAQPGAPIPAAPVSGRSLQWAQDPRLAPDPCRQPGLEYSPLLDPDLALQTRI